MIKSILGTFWGQVNPEDGRRGLNTADHDRVEIVTPSKSS